MARISKRKKAFSDIVPSGEVSLEDAVALIERFPVVKFDETVELHCHLNLSAKGSDPNIRGTVSLPHGTGKSVRVAVVCKGESVRLAQDAGADIVGGEDLVEKIAQGFLDFDVVVATPDMMRDLSRVGKVLGPRGLMPSPKAGTVTQDVAKVIEEIKKGRIEFKSDKQAGVHVGIGKRSFSKEKILANARHLLDAIEHAKPESVKGPFFRSLFLSTTMGPGVKVQCV